MMVPMRHSVRGRERQHGPKVYASTVGKLLATVDELLPARDACLVRGCGPGIVRSSTIPAYLVLGVALRVHGVQT